MEKGYKSIAFLNNHEGAACIFYGERMEEKIAKARKVASPQGRRIYFQGLENHISTFSRKCEKMLSILVLMLFLCQPLE